MTDKKIVKNGNDFVKLGSRSKVYLKSLRDMDLDLDPIIDMSPPIKPIPNNSTKPNQT